MVSKRLLKKIKHRKKYHRHQLKMLKSISKGTKTIEIPYMPLTSNEISKYGRRGIKIVRNFMRHHQETEHYSRDVGFADAPQDTNGRVTIVGFIAGYRMKFYDDYPACAKIYLLIINVVAISGSGCIHKYLADHLWINVNNFSTTGRNTEVSIGDMIIVSGKPRNYYGKVHNHAQIKEGLGYVDIIKCGYPLVDRKTGRFKGLVDYDHGHDKLFSISNINNSKIKRVKFGNELTKTEYQKVTSGKYNIGNLFHKYSGFNIKKQIYLGNSDSSRHDKDLILIKKKSGRPKKLAWLSTTHRYDYHKYDYIKLTDQQYVKQHNSQAVIRNVTRKFIAICQNHP